MIRKEVVAYNTDASRIIGKVEKVVFPKNVKEVSEIIRITNMDIVPRGAGTGFEGGVVPNGSLVMDMTKMNNILSFNPSKRVIVVEAGIILKELNEKLMAKGYEFPIDLLNKGISSIGGMIATNASGKRAMKYGSIRDWLDEIEFVNGKGEIIKTSKADLTDACGMEGITGVITSAKIRVLPRIRRSFSIFQTDKLEDALHVGRRLKSEKEVCSIILFSKQISKMLGFVEKYYLLVEFDSERGKIKGVEYEKLLKKVENLYYTLGLNDYYNSEDPRLFFDKIQEFLEILDLKNIPYFSYLGNGIIHPFFKDSEKDRRMNLLTYIKRTQIKLGKYGYGLSRKEYLESFESKLIQRVKQRHDPSGKLNKGKLVDFTGFIKKSEPREERVEKLRKDGKLKDSFKEERLDIRPSLGEELTAKNIPSECRVKDPAKEIEDFIKDVENFENSQKFDIGSISSQIEKVENNIQKFDMGSMHSQVEKIEDMEDYEDDFQRFDLEMASPKIEKVENSFLNKEKKDSSMDRTGKKYIMEGQTKLSFLERKEVENYAKGIPKEIVKESHIPLKPRLAADYDAIKHDAEQKSKENIVKRPETSQEERDLINKIMGNKFGNINKGDKK